MMSFTFEGPFVHFIDEIGFHLVVFLSNEADSFNEFSRNVS